MNNINEGIRAVAEPPVLREVVQDVVDGIRARHSSCPRGCCPWPSMWDEDVQEFVSLLADAGVVVNARE